MDPYHLCLAHLNDADRTEYLAGLAPGAAIDHRGTVFTPTLLSQLLDALRDPAGGHPRLGDAEFGNATFHGTARFGGTRFDGTARFGSATFTGTARFSRAVFASTTRFACASFARDAEFAGAVFEGTTRFYGATFAGSAGFSGVRCNGTAEWGRSVFGGEALFSRAVFDGAARFGGVTFTADARFGRAAFHRTALFGRTAFAGEAEFNGAAFAGAARFHGATFARTADFYGATFETASMLGPLVCRGKLDLSEVSFCGPVTIEAAAASLVCRRTLWAASATLRPRYATLDFSDAVTESPLRVAARPSPFAASSGGLLDESPLEGLEPGVRVVSVSGVDTAHMVLADINLSACRFTGAVHLDQLRLEGRCTFASTPTGIHRRGPVWARWTPRRTLAEEHHWRAAGGSAGWSPSSGTDTPAPASLAPVYRQLRKSLEDGKNEPDAADFYYGEMEMRRHDPDRPRSERALLTAYWALSGYGLRASRALSWLLLAVITTVLAMMLWGVPLHSTQPSSDGAVTARRIHLVSDAPDPANPTGPLLGRLSGRRFEKSLRVVVNSVIFRSSGQDLTTAGTYLEMASRLTEPVLLGFGLLAVRGRVKR
ncbi:pentapeptide repeat-containing protein [Streptomyces sp. NBC_00859]|uniref:pentapeptide repeat-containing protein n=1 Tax=Streptomyces sp. NBC_00859 TaxID=2903682 RepID=UPI00386BE4E9|nr:pentapeptide repeat-containing protein [Streptomyces sp. NBC_00859]